MKRIPLTRGLYTIVDDEDYGWLNQFKWCALKTRSGFYAARRMKQTKSQKKGAFILMHRLIMNAPKGTETDHRNNNSLDNRRPNLRLCNHSQNLQNQRPHKNETSKYKGVCKYKRDNNWRAYITKGQKYFHLGYFSNETKAAKAYDKKAKEFFGEFARINF